eukprot:382795-Hanusia_phi.AAC.1
MATIDSTDRSNDNFYSRKFRSMQAGEGGYRCYCPIAPIKYAGHKPMMALESIDVKPYSRHMSPAVSYPRFLDQYDAPRPRLATPASSLLSSFVLTLSSLTSLTCRALQETRAPVHGDELAHPPAMAPPACPDTLTATARKVANSEPGQQEQDARQTAGLVVSFEGSSPAQGREAVRQEGAGRAG